MEVANMGEMLDKKKGNGDYDVDASKLSGGYEEKDVMFYMRKLHRRTLPDWQKYGFLREQGRAAGGGGGGTISGNVSLPAPRFEGASTFIERGAPTVVDNKTTGGTTTTTTTLAKKNPGAFGITAFILLVIAAITARMPLPTA